MNYESPRQSRAIALAALSVTGAHVEQQAVTVIVDALVRRMTAIHGSRDWIVVIDHDSQNVVVRRRADLHIAKPQAGRVV